MDALKYDIEILNADDDKASYIPIKVIIKNVGTARATVKSLMPSMDDDVVLEEKINTDDEKVRKKFQALCDDLTHILDVTRVDEAQNRKRKILESFINVYNERSSKISRFYGVLLSSALGHPILEVEEIA